MGGRTIPHVCPHGRTLHWNDLGPDPDDGSVGAETCIHCDWAESTIDASWAVWAETACHRCGTDPAEGNALIFDGPSVRRYCHGDGRPSCYELATWELYGPPDGHEWLRGLAYRTPEQGPQ